MANSCRAEFTTCVAGGSGRSTASSDDPRYRAIESCSRAPQMGERSCHILVVSQ